MINYEELLTYIRYELEIAEKEDACGDGGHPPTHRALLSVVLIHKPEGLESDPKCYECQGLDAVDWPCATVVAIDRALRG